MAQIGYGYGSEFQLLRFLGHHRDLLEKEIKMQIHGEGEIHWLDFGFAEGTKSISGDSEKQGLGFIKDLYGARRYKDVVALYRKYQVSSMISHQSWDAIFTIGDSLYLVEAKAHPEEMRSENERKSEKEILKFMTEILAPINVTDEWVGDYYQLANRLATAALLNKCGIKAKALCLFFENGFIKKELDKRKVKVLNPNDPPITKEIFEREIEEEFNKLGITYKDVEIYLTPRVFIDANPKPKYTNHAVGV